MKKLAILGLGHIGMSVFNTLMQDDRFEVTGYDLSNGHDLSNVEILTAIIKTVDGVLASTPFYLNTKIAEICNQEGVDYFDLTESVEVTEFVKTLNNAAFVTQCGLAPGMVSVIANYIANQFDSVSDIEIRVGALPENASNHMGYYRTWNTEGLINEYIHPCPAIKDGKLVELDPLADIEDVMLNGAHLEAANTSGGIGSLPQSWLGRAKNVNYKTLRYPGHWSMMKFLKDDLGMKENFDTYVKLFNNHVPQTDKDFVFILINVKGTMNNNFAIRQYSKIIESKNGVTAIQRTTAGGVMSVLDSWVEGNINNKGWVKQEDLDFNSVWQSRYSEAYH
jgi:saccharopine dehydrogenase-like NADP-dependent oxidoreductase